MESKAGAQISAKAFIQSVIILFVIMMVAGVLTIIVPAGRYERIAQGGRELINADSFQFVEQPDYPIWRWFTAPVEVLGGSDGLIVIVIIFFILMVGGAFAVLDRVGILKAGIAKIVRAFGGKKYLLLLVISFFFMLLGAFFGILEEIVPLVPLMLALSYYLGWDALVGLGMSVLATNMGFSAAITNPFTIGIAQKIAGLPLFSGAWFRVPIFLAIYAVFAIFLVRYAKKIERNPETSLVHDEDQAERAKYAALDLEAIAQSSPHLGRAMGWFSVFLALILFVLIGGPFIPAVSDYALPLVGIFFLIGGIGAGMLAGGEKKAVFKALWEGVSGIAPGILLILMAVSIKHIVVSGGIMDTILHSAAQPFSQASPFVSAVIIYFLALLIEFFVASGSAKAFLMMPILLPLADLVGVTRQVTVTAYCFGDGFSNLVYPTNPLLLIILGLTVVSYPKWLKWTLPLWGVVILVTVAFLALGVAIGYGPF
ncbi:MAG: YfcC family protein [Chloroflexi bacterium]|jgi:uncharacterized ion transporter superfamily protein YfcC|nr:YfcC family protein [Chloroflexota bacterium]